MPRGVFAAQTCAARWPSCAAATRPGRRDAAERTVFKSVGTALEDLAAAELVFDAVRANRYPRAA